ncbi:biotin/lipoyl-binding protein [Hymenobacter humi]|uniref:Biotin/lipoyl-binding protein n=1 Tax=Hymenobacter humi TaxID=1411620 RepID=A0ABW2UEF7_9BACT
MRLLLALPALLAACHSGDPAEEAAGPAPRAQVKTVRPVTQALEEFVSFPATSIYPRKSAVTAPIAAYVTGVRVRIGDRVSAGQVLFTLETKERRALGGSINRIDPSLRDFGLQTVKAPASGVVSLLDQPQPGAYVLEGAPLCTVAESSQLVFQLSLPYEYHQAGRRPAHGHHPAARQHPNDRHRAGPAGQREPRPGRSLPGAPAERDGRDSRKPGGAGAPDQGPPRGGPAAAGLRRALGRDAG